MKLSIYGIDTIELEKRYAQHRSDIKHIIDSKYLEFKERCFQLHKKNVQFNRSLAKAEAVYVKELAIQDIENQDAKGMI